MRTHASPRSQALEWWWTTGVLVVSDRAQRPGAPDAEADRPHDETGRAVHRPRRPRPRPVLRERDHRRRVPAPRPAVRRHRARPEVRAPRARTASRRGGRGAVAASVTGGAGVSARVVAAGRLARHAHDVPFKYDPGTGKGGGGEQVGMALVLPEEAPLPSEVVMSGGRLDTRRKEAMAQIRGLLLDRDPSLSPEEHRVVNAILASPTAHLPRAPGTPAKMLGAIHVARECFPGYSATAALRKYHEVRERPAVKSFLADYRALELADVAEQRGMVREALHAVVTRGTDALYALSADESPNEWAKVAACVTAACQVIADMDGLAQRAGEGDGDGGQVVEAQATDADALQARVRKVAADLRARVP